MESISPAASAVPSTSAPSSLTGDMTLEAIIAQFQHMDARLDTLSNELCQVNTHVGRITQRHARFGGFAASSSPSLEASTDEDGDDGDNGEDEDVSSSSNDEMTTSR